MKVIGAGLYVGLTCIASVYVLGRFLNIPPSPESVLIQAVLSAMFWELWEATND